MDEPYLDEKRTKDKSPPSKSIEVTTKNYVPENSSLIAISRKMRCIVFTILNIVFILMSLDQGIISSTTNSFKDLSELELGGLGSIIFLGIAIGCVFSFTLINKFNRKYLLLATMCFDALSLFLTTQTTKIALLYLCRVIAGFTQSFLSIYIPVWSDQFGIHKYKSIWLSIIHISSALGYLFGFVFGTFLGWENAFYLQNILIVINLVIIFIFIPDLYFSMNLMPLKAKLFLQNEKENDQITKDINNINMDMNLIDKPKNNELSTNLNEKNDKKKTKDEDDISLFEDFQKKDDVRKDSIISHLIILLKSPIFILINITLFSMYIIVSAVQFWINDYLEFGLLIDDEKKRLYSFTFVVVTSPAAGIIVGGLLATKVGGYDTEKAIYIPLIASFLVCILANITPITSNVIVFLPLFWAYLFFGSVLLPVVSGIILVSVEKKYAGSASSVSTLIYNILGRLPGPYLYAVFKSLVNDKNSRIPFWILLNMAIFGFIAVLICVKFQREKYRKIRNENSEEKELLLDGQNKEDKEMI